MTHSSVTWLIRHPSGLVTTMTTGSPHGPGSHNKPDLTDYPRSQFPDGCVIVGSFAHQVGSFHTHQLEKDWEDRYPSFHVIHLPDGTAQCWKNWEVANIRTSRAATSWLKRMEKKHDHGFPPRRGIVSKEGIFDLYSCGYWARSTSKRAEAQAWLKGGKATS